MQRVRLFKGVEMEMLELEQSINQWLEESKARIISVAGNIAPHASGSSGFGSSDILVIVTYEADE